MEPTSREDLLDAVADVMERQARVARAEAALAAARRRLGESVTNLSRVARARGECAPLPPVVVAALSLGEGLPPVGEGAVLEEERAGTLRERIVAVMEASPEEVYTPARLAPMLGARSRDSVRNTLLVLAAKGRIEKRGAGQYQAKTAPGAPNQRPSPRPAALAT